MLNIYKNLYLHYSFLLVVFCLFLGGNCYSLGLTLLSVIFHECGHIIAMLICGIKPEKLVLHSFGISLNAPQPSASKTFVIASSGPVFSLILAGLFYFVFPPLFSMNLCIGLINLLPALPLDGGRILSFLLTRITGKKGSRLFMRYIGVITGIIALPPGILLFINSGYNLSLIMLGVFMMTEPFNTPFPEPVSFIFKKVTLGEIYLIPQNMSLRKTAEILPAGSLGAIIDENGEVLRLVTAKGLYNHLAQPSKDSL